ncbi:unnamed protein product [Angiostrongylus costaricensis]|uniref:Lipase_GDSL domain-containing protein n=1 Tax=Angiostrongylus costaricensis TaxID=334426 RepID=A0A0R3PDF4_ANGCS|nr:unnamed protein product [Angiostrongylus costaricensis]
MCYKLSDFGVPGYSCDAELMKPSKTIPSNVNAVRPADIKVIMFHLLVSGKTSDSLGLAFHAGGDKSLDEHVTIPNILKKYNPNLFGYSVGIGSPNVWEIAHLNVAMPGANAADLPRQARQLVGLLEQHPQSVNIKDDWKLLNIFIGGNDICDYCTSPVLPRICVEHIKEAIQIIYDKVPRVIVSLTAMMHLELLRQTDHGHFFCTLLHREECSCESNKTFTDADIAKACVEYSNHEIALGASGVFEKEDFTLVVQPFLRDITQPPMKGGKYDMEIFAPDCFHLSQYGHALVSTWLWKNILEPVGNKTTEGSLSGPALPLACPDTNCPFIRTNLNSANCNKYMTLAT